jgi:hypothetical protein
MPEGTINQGAYVLGVTKQTILQDIFKTFWAVLGKHVHPKTTKFWFPSFPYEDLNKGKLSYPIGIIDSPELVFEHYKIEKRWAMGSITITVFATNSGDADLYAQQVISGVDSELKELWRLNLRKVSLDSMSQGFLQQESIYVHNRELTYVFQYPYTSGLFE